ncbi:hypothetical protein ACFX1R_018327 [Malus domestica]
MVILVDFGGEILRWEVRSIGLIGIVYVCKKVKAGWVLKTWRLSIVAMAKQCWRIVQNPNAFWVQVLKARYFPNSDFMMASRGSRPSWAWSSLLEGRKIIERVAK